MGRLLAYIGNDPARLRCALYPGRALLVDDGKGCDGFGVGFYQGGEVLLQRRPKAPGGPIDLAEITRDVRSDALIAHVRRGTHGAPKNENTHPFRFRSWLFAHHGSVAGFDEGMRERLFGDTKDYLRRNVRGETDSEVLFHVFLDRLHQTGKMDDPTIAPGVVAEALAETVARCEERVGSRLSVLDMAATNGRVAVVSRVGAPLFHYRVQGVRDCPVCRDAPAEFGRGSRPADHEHLRAVVLVAPGDGLSGTPPSPWEEVPERSVVAVSHDLGMETVSLQ